MYKWTSDDYFWGHFGTFMNFFLENYFWIEVGTNSTIFIVAETSKKWLIFLIESSKRGETAMGASLTHWNSNTAMGLAHQKKE